MDEVLFAQSDEHVCCIREIRKKIGHTVLLCSGLVTHAEDTHTCYKRDAWKAHLIGHSPPEPTPMIKLEASLSVPPIDTIIVIDATVAF